MKAIYSLFIPGTPIAQSRPRINTKTRGRYYANADKIDQWKNAILSRIESNQMIKRMGLLTGPLEVDCLFLFHDEKMAKNTYAWKSTKPDGDNLEKAVWDCLTYNQKTNRGIWKDDSQIVTHKCEKRWTGGESGLQLAIYKLPNVINYPM
jgi:Holliday junction resolvase RusA-like endonuclease